MHNRIATTVTGLVTQTQGAIAGLTTYAATLNLSSASSAALSAELTAYLAAQITCKAEREELSKRRTTVTGLKGSAAEFMTLCRETLKPHLGKVHTPEWTTAGLEGSLAIPRKEDKMLAALSGFAKHFGDTPEHENEKLNVLGARATSFFNDITNARTAVNTQKTTLAEALTARETKGNNIRRMLRALLKELSSKLDPLDDRYVSFGFNKPGQLATPEIPTNVTVVLFGPTAAAVKWDAAARASHYRVWKRVVGVDEELIPVGNPSDLDFAMEGLPANATIEIAVSAVNDTGESAKTKVVTVTTA